MTASSRPMSPYGDPGGPDCRCGAEHRPRQLVGMTDGGGNGERNVRTAVDLINDFVRDGASVFALPRRAKSFGGDFGNLAGLSGALAKIQSKREFALTPGIEGTFKFARAEQTEITSTYTKHRLSVSLEHASV